MPGRKAQQEEGKKLKESPSCMTGGEESRCFGVLLSLLQHSCWALLCISLTVHPELTRGSRVRPGSFQLFLPHGLNQDWMLVLCQRANPGEGSVQGAGGTTQALTCPPALPQRHKV